MKRFFITAVLVASVMLTASAQLFVGGGIGLDISGGKDVVGPTTTDKLSSTTFQFSPKVGFFVSEDFAVGVNFGISTWSQTTPKDHFAQGNPADERKQSNTSWDVGAFARVGLIGIDNILLSVEAGFGVGGTSSKTVQGSQTTEGNPSSRFQVGVLPVVNYRLSDALSLELTADFLRLGFITSTTTTK